MKRGKKNAKRVAHVEDLVVGQIEIQSHVSTSLEKETKTTFHFDYLSLAFSLSLFLVIQYKPENPFECIKWPSTSICC